MNTVHCMVDLETLSVSSDAFICAIGAVAFTKKETIASFYVVIKSPVGNGQIDADTVFWWITQPDAALQFQATLPSGLQEALLMFTNWFKSNNCQTLWGNGANFDNVILANAYKRNSLPPPWQFWQDRCYRTIKQMAKAYHIPDMPKFEGVPHNALDDATHQAKCLIEINKVIAGVIES